MFRPKLQTVLSVWEVSTAGSRPSDHLQQQLWLCWHQTDLVRPSWSLCDPVTGNYVKWEGQMEIIRRPCEGWILRSPFLARSRSYLLQPQIHRQTEGWWAIPVLPQGMTSTFWIPMVIKVSDFNPINLPHCFLFVKKLNIGWGSEQWLLQWQVSGFD